MSASCRRSLATALLWLIVAVMSTNIYIRSTAAVIVAVNTWCFVLQDRRDRGRPA